ncbi:hypothetical protein ANN_25897 [Periplaneta americana]|uniref:Uncharacterized protein n=1 Tax=Periplaneta americana TaxID=6978 RepID=A0ABQ8S4N0_PERAM|nr:hypothetical protein ANN_25897 [Periplaneta americana]
MICDAAVNKKPAHTSFQADWFLLCNPTRRFSISFDVYTSPKHRKMKIKLPYDIPYGKINKHNCRVWGTQKPHRIIEHERDSPKVNVFCALSQRKLYGPFFFIEATVTGHSYLEMLEQWLVPQLRQDLNDDFIFQQDGAPPHFHNAVRAYLNTEMSDRWIGHAGVRDRCFMTWPPRSPDMTAWSTAEYSMEGNLLSIRLDHQSGQQLPPDWLPLPPTRMCLAARHIMFVDDDGGDNDKDVDNDDDDNRLALWSLPSKETLRGHSDTSFRGEGYIQCCVGVRLCDMYSNQELAEMHFMYGKADGNAALARRLYQERYPQRQCSDRKTFVPYYMEMSMFVPSIAGDVLVGSHVLPLRLNRERYKVFLRYTLLVLLHHVPLSIRRNTNFMHDGASAHFSVNGRRFLNQRFCDMDR